MSLGRQARRAVAWVALLGAACEPQARRALVLDLALSDPALLESTARPWRDAGYSVDYRRFYPHLAASDLPRYHALVVLLGQAPEAPSDALTTGDLTLLSRALRSGMVVVIGYSGDATGSLDRWTANRWLASEGAGIGIGDAPLEDTTGWVGALQAQPWAAAQPVRATPLGSVYEPFPFDRNHPLAVRDRAQVLATGSRHAFVRNARLTVPRPDAPIVAATRVDVGLVLVLSRHALGALGPQDAPSTAPMLQLGALTNTEDFLSALARWTRRPAEWAHVPPAAHATSLTLAGAPIPVEVAPAPQAAPTGVGIEPLTGPPTDPGPVGVPPWVKQSGMRALWTPLLAPTLPSAGVRPAVLDSLVAFLDEGGFNLLVGDADPEAVGDSAHHRGDERSAVRRTWSEVVAQLQPTSVAWIPALAYWPARLPPVAGDSSRGTRGEARAVACALDSTVWSGVLPAFSALAHLAGGARELVPALALDLETPGAPTGYTMGQEFCDIAWRNAVPRLPHHETLDSVPRPARYRVLRDQGLLEPYYQALEQTVAQHARAMRDRALREHPGLYFAVRLERPPGDWFTQGVLRGFSLPDRPLLLFTPEVDTRAVMAAYRARGLNMVHAVELPMDLLRPRNLAALKRVVFGGNDGFWLASAPPEPHRAPAPGAPQPPSSDSVANVLRRLAR